MKSADLNATIAAAEKLAAEGLDAATKAAARRYIDHAVKLKLRLMASEHTARMVALAPVKEQV